MTTTNNKNNNKKQTNQKHTATYLLTYKRTQATKTQKLGFRAQKSKVPSSAGMRA
jgi:hypothetical protein